ncbi:MAG: hypothetical protein KC503_24185 [Myxococcales bacterium]|nr:hypothetical protein [Myxococcales bacterium]
MRKVTKRDKIIAAVILLLVVALLAAATFLFILPEMRRRDEAQQAKSNMGRWVTAFAAFRRCIIGNGKPARTLAMRSNEIEYENVNRACAKKQAAALVDAPPAVKTLITSRLGVRGQAGCKLIRAAHDALTAAATKHGLTPPEGVAPPCLKVPAPNEQTPEHLRVWKPKRTWVVDGWLHALVVGLTRCGGRSFAARSLDGESWQKIKLDPCFQPTRVVAWQDSRLVGVFIGAKPDDPPVRCCHPKPPKGGKKKKKKKRRRRRRKKAATEQPPPLLLLTYKDKEWQPVARLPKGHIPRRVVLGPGDTIFVEGERRAEGKAPVFEVLRYSEGTPGVQVVRPLGRASTGAQAAANTGPSGHVVAALNRGGKLAVVHVGPKKRRGKAIKLPAMPAALSKDSPVAICRAKKGRLWLLAGKSLLSSADDGATFTPVGALDQRYKLGPCDQNTVIVSGHKRVRVCTASACAAAAELRAEPRGLDLKDGVVRVCTKGKLASVALRYVTKPKPSFRAKLLVASCDRLEWAWKQK